MSDSNSNSKIMIENVASLGKTYRVDREKYLSVRDALIAVLPVGPPGIAVTEAKAALLPRLPEELFPNGAKAGWWLKAVHLDLEAKGLVQRSSKPMRLFNVSDPD